MTLALKYLTYLTCILFLCGCSEYLNTNEELSTPYDSFIIVKAVDPSDNKLKFGAFSLQSSVDADGSNLQWIFIDDGTKVFNITLENAIMGRSFAEPVSGIQFTIFNIPFSQKNEANYWIESEQEYVNQYSTEFCISNILKLGDLNNYDFSSCVNFNN